MRQTGLNRRALTVYFATEGEKQAFDKMAASVGISASVMALMIIHHGVKGGFMTRLMKVMPNTKASVQKLTKVIVSKKRRPTTSRKTRSSGVSAKKE